jgi:hypothetical protein
MKFPPRIPTDAEYAAYRGEHCFALWRRVGSSWVCPACGRTRREIMRWTRRGARPCIGITQPFNGWMAGLHTHHDHGANVSEGDYGFYRPELARFDATIICDQCNSADGRAKRQLQLPAAFSFSPEEIRAFVIAAPHVSHRLRLDVALRLFKATLGKGAGLATV